MTKQELLNKIAQAAGMERQEAAKIMQAFEDVVIKALRNGEEVTLTGFGTWLAKFRSARGGVNPRRPNERIEVPAVTVPKFRAGKRLKDAIKNAHENQHEEGDKKDEIDGKTE